MSGNMHERAGEHVCRYGRPQVASNRWHRHRSVSQRSGSLALPTRKGRSVPDRERVFKAIRDSWSPETCGEPEKFSPDNPSWQQCDASAFVAWEHLGGDLVLGKVFLDGERTEHHYWNRIDGEDFDLTREQFQNGENIVEANVVPS